jgi:beta-mannosidase
MAATSPRPWRLLFFCGAFLAGFGPMAEASTDPQAVVDLDGPWLLKDYTAGVGVTKQVQLPGHAPKDGRPVQVPGTVRQALVAAGEIPDPYFGYDNEKSLWVEQKEWWFFRTFSLGAEYSGRHIDLVFEGTSFQGEVWLNGQLAGSLKGMLNPRAFDVSGLLQYGAENTLAVRLEATPDARETQIARGLTWRAPRDQLFSIAQCMYGWDWGPHGVPIGIWRPVRLRVSGPLRLDHPYVRSRLLSPSLAHCGVDLDVRNLSQEPKEATLRGAFVEKDTKRRAAEFRQSFQLAPGETRTVHVDVGVRNPRLWWPNGMGPQNLYFLEATVSDAAGESERLRTQFGIRELKLVANDRVDEFLKTMKEHLGDAHHLGNVVGSYPWTFQVNGRRMFAKGGNWIPADQLLRLDRGRYERLLSLARDGYYNLLRVWGGGLYETEDFYELCDEYGILAWQEFLSNRSFSKIDRESFLEGAEAAIFRLRNHPSLTFWCGGNEFDPDDAGSKAVIDSLDALLKTADPEREFHRASPYMGDDHYWGVWHHKEPYTAYRIVRPFRSEAGINAPPVLEDYLKFTPESLRWPLDATYVEYRGEQNTRFSHLDKLLHYANQFGASTGLEELIRKSQLYQALGNEFDMEYCRSNKFRTSGFLVWQYNDIWPAISWATVDWYGTPKPAYYFQKRASRPVHVATDFERYLWKPGETFSADVSLLNDTEAPVKSGTFKARILDVQGTTLAERNGLSHGGANASSKLTRIEYPIPEEMAGQTFFISAQLLDPQGREISSVLYPIAVSRTDDYQGIFSALSAMPSVEVHADLAPVEWRWNADGTAQGTLRLSNPSASMAFFVRVRLVEESEKLLSSWSDNYISLLPGESDLIAVSVESKAAVPAQLHFEVSGWNCPRKELELRFGEP